MKLLTQILSACFTCLAVTSMASAETMQISASGFTAHGPNPGEVNQGLLLNAQGKYYAPVVFPAKGQLVCRFKLVYRDNDTDVDLTARLFRKLAIIGGNPFDPPVLMASVSSSGAAATTRRAATAIIVQRVINNTNSLYYVEIDFPLTTLEALGVEIDVQPTCP